MSEVVRDAPDQCPECGAPGPLFYDIAVDKYLCWKAACFRQAYYRAVYRTHALQQRITALERAQVPESMNHVFHE